MHQTAQCCYNAFLTKHYTFLDYNRIKQRPSIYKNPQYKLIPSETIQTKIKKLFHFEFELKIHCGIAQFIL